MMIFWPIPKNSDIFWTVGPISHSINASGHLCNAILRHMAVNIIRKVWPFAYQKGDFDISVSFVC